MTVQELHEVDKAQLIHWLQMKEQECTKLMARSNKQVLRIQELEKGYKAMVGQIDGVNHRAAGQIQVNNEQLNELVEENIRLQTRISGLEECNGDNN